MLKTILIAQNEVIFWSLRGAIVRSKRPYRVLIGRDKEEVLRLVQREKPSVLILDEAVSGEDSYQICRWLKSELSTASVKVIMLMCPGLHSDWRKAQEVQADECLNRPFNSTELLKKIEDTLEDEHFLMKLHKR